MHVRASTQTLFNHMPVRLRLAVAGALLALALLALGLTPRPAGAQLAARTPAEGPDTGLTPQSAEAQAAYGRPDLVVRSFGLVAWGACVPGSPVYTF